MLIGEAGTGKTTLIRATLEARDPGKTQAIYMNNPTLTKSEFLEFLAGEFELPSKFATSKTRLLKDLEVALIDLHKAKITPALIIDEAQSLPHELLEEIRLLANIETMQDKLLPIVLAGQPELAERLNHPSLRQLKQRVGLRCQLRQLDLGETGAYITARIAVAGGQAATVFTREAVMIIHERSQGIPRLISVICNNVLISGFALNQRPVTASIVREVCEDFDLKSTAGMAVLPQLAPTGAISEPSQGPASKPRSAGRELFNSLPRPKRGFSFF